MTFQRLWGLVRRRLTNRSRQRGAVVARVLIFRTGYLGDTVVALPALRLIASAFPHAARHVLTQFNEHGAKAAPLAQLLAGTGLVDGYIQYPSHVRKAADLLALRRAIRQFRPDVLIYLAPGLDGQLKIWRDILFFRSCGISRIVGAPQSPGLLKPQRVDSELFEYEGARLLRCLRTLGELSLDVDGAFDLNLTSHERASGDAALAGLPEDSSILVVSIGAKVPVKDWGDSNWSALLHQLSGILQGWSLVMIGSAVERDRSEKLRVSWTGPSLNLCGNISVRLSAAVTERAHLFIGHDSGPMHLAAAVGTTCVAIFSARRLPGVWFPWGRSHHVLYRDVSCRNCNLDVCIQHAKMCIESITVDDVIHEVRSALHLGPHQNCGLPTQGTMDAS
jgi:ADP-heptose:LPS heptosyltransferase